jgi:hypothetical protein
MKSAKNREDKMNRIKYSEKMAYTGHYSVYEMVRLRQTEIIMTKPDPQEVV